MNYFAREKISEIVWCMSQTIMKNCCLQATHLFTHLGNRRTQQRLFSNCRDWQFLHFCWWLGYARGRELAALDAWIHILIRIWELHKGSDDVDDIGSSRFHSKRLLTFAVVDFKHIDSQNWDTGAALLCYFILIFIWTRQVGDQCSHSW